MNGEGTQRGIDAVALIGPGRAGRALARAWRAAGVSVALVVGRRREAAEALAAEVGARALAWDELLRARPPAGLPGVVVLAVPDRAVGTVAESLGRWLAGAPARSPRGAPRHVLHLSGALGLEPLAPLARLGLVPEVFHPLAALTGGPGDAQRLRGARVTVVHPAGAEPAGPRLAAALGAVPVLWSSPSDHQLALYHAAATLAANALTALLWAAEDLLARAGYPAAEGRAGLAALAAGAVANAAEQGPLAALTGPIARGDAVTVRRHLEALAAAGAGDGGRGGGSAGLGPAAGPEGRYRLAAALVLAAAAARLASPAGGTEAGGPRSTGGRPAPGAAAPDAGAGPLPEPGPGAARGAAPAAGAGSLPAAGGPVAGSPAEMPAALAGIARLLGIPVAAPAACDRPTGGTAVP